MFPARSSRCVYAAGICLWVVLSSVIPALAKEPDYGRQVEANQRLKTLEMLIAKMKENYQRIKSWSGTYEATSRVRLFRVNESLPENQSNPNDWVSGVGRWIAETSSPARMRAMGSG